MYIAIVLKTIFMYFFIIVVYRIMGKKEIGQFNIVDLIVSLLIAELVAIGIEDKENNILLSVIPITSLVLIQILVSFISLKNDKIRYLIDGKPNVIIKNGKINFNEMKKIRYSLDDLLTQLRLEGVKNIEKVKYAILENNGSLSVFCDNSTYPLPLILDGIVDYNVLNEINKDFNWLIKLLNDKNIELDEIFYAFYTSGKMFIIKKSELL